MDTRRRDLELAPRRPAVEGLDVFKLMDKPQPSGIQPVVRQRVEHERVIRIGAVPHPDGRQLWRCHLRPSPAVSPLQVVRTVLYARGATTACIRFVFQLRPRPRTTPGREREMLVIGPEHRFQMAFSRIPSNSSSDSFTGLPCMLLARWAVGMMREHSATVNPATRNGGIFSSVPRARTHSTPSAAWAAGLPVRMRATSAKRGNVAARARSSC